jgi:hypothetical protein
MYSGSSFYSEGPSVESLHQVLEEFFMGVFNPLNAIVSWSFIKYVGRR